jgi:glyoxylase-like metal-dependent hydrolase (beta-lactamase superfamily II)
VAGGVDGTGAKGQQPSSNAITVTQAAAVELMAVPLPLHDVIDRLFEAALEPVHSPNHSIYLWPDCLFCPYVR